MDKVILGALAVTLLCGLAVGVQSTFTNLSGRMAGALNTGMLVNFGGSLASLLVLAFLFARGESLPWAGIRASAPYWFLAGALGVGIVAGIAFSLPKVGLAAGLAGIILGQMVAAVVIDALGWGGKRIPFTPSRLGGLALLIVAVWLIVPKR